MDMSYADLASLVEDLNRYIDQTWPEGIDPDSFMVRFTDRGSDIQVDFYVKR